MRSVVDNRRFYEETAFDSWATRSGLTEVETALVSRFLDGRRSTLEAGTGAGRILFGLQERGFGDLHGFDYVPGFIDIARRRDRSGSIELSVQDAVDLDYPDGRFEQAIYLQQILCFIEDPAARSRAMREASRVLRPGGPALFSFLCFESRNRRAPYAAFTQYLRLQRRFRRREVSPQYQPWLMAGAKPNLGALADRAPYVYWYRLDEALDSLAQAGFAVTWAGSTKQIVDPASGRDARQLDRSRLDGMLYVVCRRT